MILITPDWYTAIDLACVIQYFIVNTENQEQFAFLFLLGTAGWFNVSMATWHFKLSGMMLCLVDFMRLAQDSHAKTGDLQHCCIIRRYTWGKSWAAMSLIIDFVAQ